MFLTSPCSSGTGAGSNSPLVRIKTMKLKCQPLMGELPRDFLTFPENIQAPWRKIPLEINDS